MYQVSTPAKFVLNGPVFTMLLNHAHTGSQDLRVEYVTCMNNILAILAQLAYFDPHIENHDKANRHEYEKKGDIPVGKAPCLSYSSRSSASSFLAKHSQVDHTCSFRSVRRVLGAAP